MRRTCSGSAVPGCVVRLSTKLQTPGLPEGQKKGRLGFFSPLSSCPLFASCSTSLALSFIPPSLLFFPVSAILELVETAAVQPAHWHPMQPARPFPSIMAECSPLFAGRNFKLSGSVTLKLVGLPKALEKLIMCQKVQSECVFSGSLDLSHPLGSISPRQQDFSQEWVHWEESKDLGCCLEV